jgi:hypothetical protein
LTAWSGFFYPPHTSGNALEDFLLLFKQKKGAGGCNICLPSGAETVDLQFKEPVLLKFEIEISAVQC